MEVSVQYASMDKVKAREFFTTANSDILAGWKETPLRMLLCTYLPMMFPSMPWWITEHARLAESNSKYRIDTTDHDGFADTLMGYTAVEYEKNLENGPLFEEGKSQVEDYCAGLLNEGVQPQDIIGVLSDTVRWYSYDVRLVSYPQEGELYGKDNIELIETDRCVMVNPEDADLDHFERFINRAYGRLGSRTLTPETLSRDLGLSGKEGTGFSSRMRAIVDTAASDRPEYADLIQELWSGFVSDKSSVDQSVFLDEYSNELYVVTLAKLIAADMVSKHHLLTSSDEISTILDGRFFVSLGIDNFVEYDYFGWINESPYLEDMVKVACDIQSSLSVYDYRNVEPDDLFGPLFAGLAGEKKILLGQVATPRWLASAMVERELALLGNRRPRLVDMCCGSGIFIIETLRQVLEGLGWPSELDEESRQIVSESIWGFDIDPLAVVLTKANWLLVMRDYIKDYPPGLHIPIFHADSLFLSSTNSELIHSRDEWLSVPLDGTGVDFPDFIFESENRQLFDVLVERCEAYAKTLAEKGQTASGDGMSRLVHGAVETVGCNQEPHKMQGLIRTGLELTETLRRLQVEGRNGIWPFVLSNGFKPNLVRGMFNGIVSNPPWLALSRLKDNPYRSSLRRQASKYGIMPRGSSFLHVELAAIFMVSSIDRYLEVGGVSACVLPNSVLVGTNQDPLRRRDYENASAPVHFCPNEIWSVPNTTFANLGCVMFATKEQSAWLGDHRTIQGRKYLTETDYEDVCFYLLESGEMSAYSTSPREKLLDALSSIPFHEGYDAMPRTVLFCKALRQKNGVWTVSSIPRRGDSLSYLVNEGHTATDFAYQPISNVDDDYLYSTLVGKQVMPFVSPTPATVVLPIIKSSNGTIREVTDVDLVGHSKGTRLLAKKIIDYYKNSGSSLISKVDYWGKLTAVLGNHSPWMVVYNKDGQDLASTYFSVEDLDCTGNLAIDQTLIWLGVNSENEALYYCGLLNSDTLNEDIKDFQARGGFGARHIYMVPARIIAPYDESDQTHQCVVESTRALVQEVRDSLRTNIEMRNLANPSVSRMNIKRPRFKNCIRGLSSYGDYEEACKAAL